jgi:hypothetical protein
MLCLVCASHDDDDMIMIEEGREGLDLAVLLYEGYVGCSACMQLVSGRGVTSVLQFHKEE